VLECYLFNLNFIYFTTITKQAIQLLLIMLVGTDVVLDGLRVGGNQSTQRKLTCLTWWPHDHLTCRRRVSAIERAIHNIHTALLLQRYLCFYRFFTA